MLEHWLQIAAAVVWKKPMSGSSMAVPKNSPYKRFMSLFIKRFIETGQHAIIFKRYELPTPNCESLLRTANPLSLPKLATAFLICVIGVGVAFGICILEKLHHTICPVSGRRNHVKMQEKYIQHVILATTQLEKYGHRNKVAIDNLMTELQQLKESL